MKQTFLIIIFVSYIISGCGSSSGTNAGIQNPHAAPHQEMHDQLIQEEIKKDQKEIETPGPESEISSAASDHPNSDFFKTKWNSGIIFYAVGNEPYWSLNISKDNKAVLKTLDGVEYSASFISKLPSVDPESTGYRLTNNKGEMIINIVEEKCGDTMADEDFPFKVSVDLKLKGEKGFTTYKGCGDYVPDPRLQGKWMIIKADSIVISEDNFEHKQPELNIDIYEGRVSGNDGCNLFNGGLQFRENEIVFGMMAGTMMACPNMEISSIISGSITDKKLRYKFKNQLVFMEGEKEVMLLKRADK
jgi:uncharacterized membrane protein